MCISAVHIIFIASLFLSRVKINSTNWPAPINAWAFIAQMVMHFSTNAEAMCSNPVEVPKFLFRVYLQLLKLQLPQRPSHLHLKSLYFCGSHY